MRSVALDVHRDFCEVAIKDESGLRLARRVKSSPKELELFAQSLAPDDQVALRRPGRRFRSRGFSSRMLGAS
jgi:transposase